MEGLVKVINEQETFLKKIHGERLTRKYEGNGYTRGYNGIKEHIDDIVIIGEIISSEVKYIENGGIYKKIREFIETKILRRKKFSVEELLEAQATNIRLLNQNLKSINLEARSENKNLIRYYEHICEELRKNILTIPERQEKLKEKTEEYNQSKQKLLTIKGYDKEYFTTEKKLRELRRNQSEEEHNYILKMKDAEKLQIEKAFLGVVEEVLRKSIHLSEIYSKDAEHVGRHIENTKEVYGRIIKQQEQFSMLKEGVGKLGTYLSKLQEGITKGLEEMNKTANGVNSLDIAYAQNMKNLKNIVEDIKNTQVEKTSKIEKTLERNKLLKR